MMRGRSADSERLRKKRDGHARTYDKYYQTFKGAVEHYVDWELLKGYLPRNRKARILDAAGGTGRITLPLAQMGYSVTLCDISSEMLKVARRKLRREGLLNKVGSAQCDIRRLCFVDESFDFVLSWNGMLEAARELIRVTKRGGKISIFLVNRCRGAIDLFSEDHGSALEVFKSRANYVYNHAERYRTVSADEARNLFETSKVKVLDIFAVCGWMDLLHISEELRESCRWSEAVFNQVTEMVLRLSKEPSVKGMSRHLVLYGEKT